MLQIIFEKSARTAWRVAHAVNHSFETLVSKYTYEGGECCFKSCPVYLERLAEQQYLSDRESEVVRWARAKRLIP